MSGNSLNENQRRIEAENQPSRSAEEQREEITSQGVEARRGLQQELTLDQQKVIFDTDADQKKMIDTTTERVKEGFKNIYNLGTLRAKNSVQSLMMGFLNEISQIDKALTEKRKAVARDTTLNDEQKVQKIKDETLKEMDAELLEIAEFAEHFAEDIKENGGKNSLEALLKAEDELKTYLDIIHSDADIREALAFVYDISFDGTPRDDKKDKIFKILATKIVNPSSNLRAWALIIKKLGINEIKEFKDKYFNQNKPLLVDMIVKNGDRYASMIYIDLYGESEYLEISGLDEKQKMQTVEGHRSITDYQAKAERFERRSIGSRNAAMDMLSGENLLGAFGMLWGTATAGLNLFVELGGGKFKKDPTKAIESALKNPYVWGGGIAAGTGYAILSGGVDSFLEDIGPENEKIEENKQKAKNRMKNLLVSDSHPLNRLIQKDSALFALASFAKNKLEIDELKHISELKNPQQSLTKKYFMQYLPVLIDDTKDPEEKKALLELKDYMKNIPYNDKDFSELVVNLATLEIGGADIKSTKKNMDAFETTLK